jgi:hypothetical protein
MRKQADALKVCPIPDACLLVMPKDLPGYLAYRKPDR